MSEHSPLSFVFWEMRCASIACIVLIICVQGEEVSLGPKTDIHIYIHMKQTQGVSS